MACCTHPTDDYVYEDSVATGSSQETDGTDETEVLNTDYKKVTPLFRNIERENWEGILTFLTTGKWASSMLTSSNEHLRSPSPEIQVKTWVTAYDRKGEPEWSQLPIHAAISYLAPFVVIQKMIQLYPKGIHCTDNEGMLPIHLAFGFGAPDNVIAILLEPFPDSINEKGLGDRYPYECCELGPNKSRGKVYKIASDQIVARTRKEMEQELRDFSSQAVKTVGVKGTGDLAKQEMTDFILELLKDRKELQAMKAAKAAAALEAAAAPAIEPRPQRARSPAISPTSEHPPISPTKAANNRKVRGASHNNKATKMPVKPPSTQKARGRPQSSRSPQSVNGDTDRKVTTNNRRY